jgi:hypothetical protein
MLANEIMDLQVSGLYKSQSKFQAIYTVQTGPHNIRMHKGPPPSSIVNISVKTLIQLGTSDNILEVESCLITQQSCTSHQDQLQHNFNRDGDTKRTHSRKTSTIWSRGGTSAIHNSQTSHRRRVH